MRRPALLFCLLLVGCGDSVEVRRVPKEGARSTPAPVEQDFASNAPRSARPPAPPGGGLRWKAPEAWIPKEASSMRLASFSVPAPDAEAKPADFSIVSLPGRAGGLLANVNRWRGQIGLDPIEASALPQNSRAIRLKSLDTEIQIVDLKGPERSTTAAILETAGKTWFFKLTGPNASVNGAKGDFVAFLQSLRSNAT